MNVVLISGQPVVANVPEVEEVLEEDVSTNLDAPWRVILYNDHIHSFDEVIVQLVKATGCSISQAEAHAWRAHVQGKASVFEGSFEECLRVKSVLDEIALITEIQG